MRKAILIALFALSFTSSVFAYGVNMSTGNYYSSKQRVQTQCDYSFYQYGRCYQQCSRAVWHSYYGTEWGYVQVWNGYGYAWDYRQVTRTWYYYTWQNFTSRCN